MSAALVIRIDVRGFGGVMQFYRGIMVNLENISLIVSGI